MDKKFLNSINSISNTKAKLICFPFAGGSVSAFRKWKNEISKFVELCLVQLPGRENRINEEPIRRLSTLVIQLADELEPIIKDNNEYFFFGHSMGALISYELTREIQKRGWQMPKKLFISGKNAPHIKRSSKNSPVYNLPKDEFIDKIRGMNGTPEEVLQNTEIMEVYLPILRADFEIVDTFEYKKGYILDCPIVAFCGMDDPLTKPSDVELWRELTNGDFTTHYFLGDHFFILQRENRKSLIQIINNELSIERV